MNTAKNSSLPPVVADMIGRLWANDSTAADNTALMLEEIERAIHREVGIYRRERTKQHRDDRENKRKRTLDGRLGRPAR